MVVLPEGMFVACFPGSSRCPLPQYHKLLPPIGHAAPRAHVKAEALPGWKWIETKLRLVERYMDSAYESRSETRRISAAFNASGHRAAAT